MLKPTIRVQRALDRAAARGRARVSLPLDVVAELLGQAQDYDVLSAGAVKIAAAIGRRELDEAAGVRPRRGEVQRVAASIGRSAEFIPTE